MKKLFSLMLCLVFVMLFTACSGSSNSSSSTTTSDDVFIAVVRDCKDSGSGMTYGDAFGDFFSNGSWSYTGEKVAYSGVFTYLGEAKTMKLSFSVNIKDSTFSIDSAQVDGETLDSPNYTISCIFAKTPDRIYSSSSDASSSGSQAASSSTYTPPASAPQTSSASSSGTQSGQAADGDNIQHIKDLYYATEDAASKMTVSTDGNGVKRFYGSDGQIKKAEVPNGTFGTNYSRIYYYENDRLYFAFIFNGTLENRFYFVGTDLIRWIDESGDIHDGTYDEAYRSWCVFCLEEAVAFGLDA